MSVTTTQSHPPRAVYTSEPIHPLSVEQYHRMIRSGELTEEDRVELLEGILVCKMTKYPPHSSSCGRLRAAIDALIPDGWHFRSQDPITLVDGEPEPDGAVVRGSFERFDSAHPGPSDVALVIEVADTSLDRDRGIKLRSYARSGVREYWIVNLNDRRIERYRDPATRAGVPTYADSTVFAESDRIPLVLDGKTLGEVSVLEILPARGT